MSAKIYLTNPKDAPFGKLSPLYDNLIPPISDKQLAIDKIGDTSSNLSCYVYAGLVKEGSVRRSLLEENPRDVNKKASIAYHQEQDRILVDALENALKEKFKSLKAQRELLSTGDHYLLYRTNVTAFNNIHPNLVGEMMMNFRTLVRRKAAEYLIQHEKESQQRSWSRIYKVYEELKNRYLNGEDLAPYFYKTYDELFTLFKLNDVINITDVRQLSTDLQNVANNTGHSAILPHLVIALNNNQLRYQQYLENLEKVRDAYFATIVPDKEERKRYVEKIPNLDNLTARIFFLWKRGFITIPEEDEANLKHEFLSVKRDTYEKIAKMFHRDILTHLGYKAIIANDPVSAYQIIKMKMAEKEDTNKNYLTRHEIENNAKGEDIVIHDNDVNNPGSLLFQEPIEIDMKKFPTILHYVVYDGLVHLGMKNVDVYRSLFESDGKGKDVGYLFKDYSEQLITYRNDIIEKRIDYSINAIYSSSLAEEGDKLPRLLVSTENKNLVYDFSVSKKIDKDSKCERCGSVSVNGECEQCNKMIVENVFAKKFIDALTSKREVLKNTVLPLSEQELPKTFKEKTMKTFFGKYHRCILEKMEEVMYAIKLLMDYKITKVSSEEIDNLISLYCAGFNRFVVGVNKMMNVRVILSRYVEMFKDRNPTDDFISHMRKILPSVRREIINKLWDEAVTLRIVMSVLNIDPDEKNVIFSEDDMVEKVDLLSQKNEKLKTQPSIQLYNHDTITLNVNTDQLPSFKPRNIVKRTKLLIELREAEAKGDAEKMENIKNELKNLVPPKENRDHKEYVTIHRHLLKNHIANSLINILYVLKTKEWVSDDLWFAFSILTTRKNFASVIDKGIQDLATYQSPRLDMISHYLNKMKGDKMIRHKNMFDSLFDYLIEELSTEDGILSRAMYFSIVPSARILMIDQEVEGEDEYRPDENIDLGVHSQIVLSSKHSKNDEEESLEESLEEDGKGEKEKQGDDYDDEIPQYEEEEDGGDYVEEYGRFDDDDE